MGSSLEEEQHDVVIVGGGIVGLATALALHRKGIESLVLEKSNSLRATGAAIGVYINGWHVLDQLGVGTELRMKAIPILEMHDTLINRNRARVVSSRNEALRCLKRSDLVEALANGLPVKSIRFGCQVTAIGTDPLTSFPVVHLDDGTNIKAKISDQKERQTPCLRIWPTFKSRHSCSKRVVILQLTKRLQNISNQLVLIGCDGSNSVVAKSLGLEAPKLFPMHAVRGFTNFPNGHIYGNTAFRLREDQAVFGRIPVDNKLVYWFVGWRSRPEDSEAGKAPQDIRDFSLELLKEFPEDVIDMVKHCDLDSLSFTSVRFRAPWNFLFHDFWRGTTTVAGDALHVMGPFLGQGGSCGLEDAVVLARCLCRELYLGLDCEIDDHEFKKRAAVALKEYVKERRLRVMRLSAQSYLVGSMIVASSWAKRVLCIFILVVFFGGMSLSHSRYNCGPL